MRTLRLLLPLLACYATDVVAFDGNYFGRFAAHSDAVPTVDGILNAGGAMAGSWSGSPERVFAALAPCAGASSCR